MKRLHFTQEIVVSEGEGNEAATAQLSDSLVQTTVFSPISIPRSLIIPSCNLKIKDLVGQGEVCLVCLLFRGYLDIHL